MIFFFSCAAGQSDQNAGMQVFIWMIICLFQDYNYKMNQPSCVGFILSSSAFTCACNRTLYKLWLNSQSKETASSTWGHVLLWAFMMDGPVRLSLWLTASPGLQTTTVRLGTDTGLRLPRGFSLKRRPILYPSLISCLCPCSPQSLRQDSRHPSWRAHAHTHTNQSHEKAALPSGFLRRSGTSRVW